MQIRLIVVALALAAGGIVDAALSHYRGLPTVEPNPNIARAGASHSGVLTVALEAKLAAYQIDGPTHAPIDIEAFSEPGKPPLLPGPLVRAPAGTEIRFSIHNSLKVPLTFF